MATYIIMVLFWSEKHLLNYYTTTNLILVLYRFLIVFVTLPHKEKFAARAYQCFFIAFSPAHKAYKGYDIDQSKVMISRYLVFRETIFPYQTNKFLDKIIHVPCTQAADAEQLKNLIDCLFDPQNMPNQNKTRLGYRFFS